MIELRNLKLSVDEVYKASESEIEAVLKSLSAKKLGISADKISSLKITKKAIDARKKTDIVYIFSVAMALSVSEKKFLNKDNIAEYEEFIYEQPQSFLKDRPVIVGFGPAGMFASLILARAGAKPIVIERGDNAEARAKKVAEFWNGGKLDIRTNVQFGEGGAGTFSDGKLNTGTHNKRISFVLDEFVKHGAKKSILYDSKPHIGTDVLIKIVVNIRKEIEALGGEIRFNEKFVGFTEENSRLNSVEIEKSDGSRYSIATKELLLCIGHSSRDSFEMLLDNGIRLEPKPFAMGVRIEHLQSDVSYSQYGENYIKLPPADYKLNVKTEDGNNAFTFCMCPGGVVAAATSEENAVVTNGMSYSMRDGLNANSALLVSLTPEDFPYKDALGGMRWQREIEESAFKLGGSNYKAPASYVGDFLKSKSSEDTKPGRVIPSYKPGVCFTDISKCLPKKISETLRKAIPLFARKLKGFDTEDAILTAPETRSSSPVRILRDEERQSNIKGIYPVGEGAGYAGGIMSSAVDGIISAEAVLFK